VAHNGKPAAAGRCENAQGCAKIARMIATPVLALRNATVVKGGRPVLHELDLTIYEGQHTAILGPNGAGKSVLVGLLTHHERALAGERDDDPVQVFGASRWNVADLRTQLGFVSPALHQQFVAGNSEGRITGTAAVLSAFLASHGILRYGAVTSEMRDRAARALAAVGAAGLAERPLHEMSSGEVRRVLLARVLVTAPRVLVLDEPTSGLDLAARHAFMERVRAVARAGTTIVLITHHVEEIVPEIDRVLFLKGGRLVDDGRREATLTSARLSGLFDTPVVVDVVDGYAYPRPGAATEAAAGAAEGQAERKLRPTSP
jgi:iron complex transport system ATP-binding protein